MKALDPRLVHVVARGYRDMQGLVTIADAMFPLLLGAGAFYFRSDTAILSYGVFLVVGFIVSLVWLRRRIQAYYAARFGRAAGFALPILVVIGQGLTAGPMLTDMHVPLVVRVPVVFLLLGGWPAWNVAHDWPYRWHWIIPAIVGAAVAFPLSSRPVDGGELAFAACFLATGAALAWAGLMDHLLLVRTLRPASDAEAPEHA